MGVIGDKNKVCVHLQKWKIQIGTRDCNEIWRVWGVDENLHEHFCLSKAAQFVRQFLGVYFKNTRRL